MVVTGIEIVALVASIVSAFYSAQQLVKEQRERLRQAQHKKLKKAKLKRLEELEWSLTHGIAAVETEYMCHYRVLGRRFRNGDGVARNSLNMVLDLQKTLLAAIRQSFIIPNDIDAQASLKGSAEKCRSEALGALEQLSQRLEAGSTLEKAPRQQRKSLGNLCQSAIAYRENRQAFDVLTRRVGGNSGLKWCCISCGRMVSRTSLSVFSNTKVWIGPSGLFKSHCGTGPGWMCIWESDTEECEQEFGTRKDLMVHMVEAHTRKVNGGLETSVDFPADSRRRGIQYCGYGVRIGDREMIESRGRFVVPA